LIVISLTPDSETSMIDPRIFSICKQISESLDHEWTVAEMASQFDLSVPHFQKLFKQETGTPPMTWLHRRRLDVFAEQLLSTYDTIKSIAFRTGLSNEGHLTEDFKRSFGFTPTGYRKHHAEIEQKDRRRPDKNR